MSTMTNALPFDAGVLPGIVSTTGSNDPAPEAIEWDTHFTKGWTDEALWREYMQARDAQDYFAMDCVIRAQNAERRPVDARIFGTSCQDLDLIEQYSLPPMKFASAERDAEHGQLIQLASMRDVPLSQLPSDLPESLRKLSYFAKHITVQPYVKGVDYMTTREDYDAIQAGMRPTTPQLAESVIRGIETGRDLATYVHKDNPMNLWTAVVGEILSMGIPLRGQFVKNDSVCREDAPFVTGHMPMWWGLIGEVIGRTGLVNFREKHRFMAARPEEYGIKRYGTLLPMAFAEGSPMHGSYKAMHDIIARACAELLTAMFDNHAEMPSGNSLAYELELMAGNVSDGRQWAGVHTEWDNRGGIELAKALGRRVANESLIS